MAKGIYVCGDIFGDGLIHIAARYDRVDVIKTIFNKYPRSIKLRNNVRETVLDVAVKFGKVKAVKFLLPKVNLDKSLGLPPLLNSAVTNGHKGVAEVLIDKGTDMNWLNRQDEDIFDVARRIDKTNRGMRMEEFLNRKVAERLQRDQGNFYSG